MCLDVLDVAQIAESAALELSVAELYNSSCKPRLMLPDLYFFSSGPMATFSPNPWM